MFRKYLNLSFTFLFVFGSFHSCDSKKASDSNKDDSFTFIERDSHNTSNYNGLIYYRRNGEKEFMGGYYVVGNTLNKWEEFELKKGLLNGDYIIYHPNGNMLSNAKYSNGKRHGEELTYTLEGALFKKRVYKNDVLVDKAFTYYENGKVKSESKIKDGEIYETVWYDDIGNINAQLFTRDGKIYKQLIKNGRVISERITTNYDSFERFKFYNEDGSFKIALEMDMNGDDAFIVELDEKGNIIKKLNVKDNIQEAMRYQAYFKGF